MLIEFNDAGGTPVYIDPRYVIAVREQKHFGRPGVGKDAEYSDTLVLTTKYEFNVKEPPEVVVRELNRVSLEAPGGGGPARAGAGDAAAAD